MEAWPGWLALAAVPLALLLGLWAGVSGYSAWPLLVPLLFVVAGLPIRECVAASMLIDAVNAVAASLTHARQGVLWPRAAFGLAPWVLGPGLLGAVAGVFLLDRASSPLRGVAGWAAVAIGAALVVRAARTGKNPPSRDAAPPAAALRLRWGRAAAAAIGFLMGAIGMGGGFSLALVGMLLWRLPTLVCVGTGLLVTATTLPILLAVHLAFLGVLLPVGPMLLGAAALSALGAVAGARFAESVPDRALGLAVGGCVIAAGAVASAQGLWLGR